MFDIITLGSLPGVIFILLNRPINIYPGIGGVKLELAECIKDNFDESLRDYIQSEEYILAKQQERRALEYLENLLNQEQRQALHSFLDANTNSNSMLLSESYLHGVVDGVALRNKVIS